MKKLYSFYSDISKVTGVLKVLLDIHQAVRKDYAAKIVGLKSYRHVNKNTKIYESEYEQWKSPFMFYDSIVILHERKFLLLFWLLNHILLQRIKVIYIHHNELYGHVWTTIMPTTIVAISDNGIKNLVETFKVPLQNIHKIHNCVVDYGYFEKSKESDGHIKVLYPARINSVKRQIEIVKHLKGRLDKRIHILFAGVGPLYEELIKEIDEDTRFTCLGFVENIPELMRTCDYVMLFSRFEGLPISLIEATMTGTPIICNDVGGNLEICHNSENGFVVNEWNNLIERLNTLPDVHSNDYFSMCQQSRRIYEQFFTFDTFKKKYLYLLDLVS